MGISERHTNERNEKAPKKWRGPFMITEVHQEGRFHRLSTGRAAHYENIKPHNPSTEDWCISADMEEGDYLTMTLLVRSTRSPKVKERWKKGRRGRNKSTTGPRSQRSDRNRRRNRTLRRGGLARPRKNGGPLDRVTGQDSRRNTILTETTS